MGRHFFISLLFLLACPAVTAQPGRNDLPTGAFPFEYYDSHIYLEMYFNDTLPGLWTFDTGAVNIYPDSTEFAGYPFKRKIYRPFRGSGEEIVTLEVVLDTIKLSNGYLDFQCDISPILDLKRILGWRPAGIVGSGIVRSIPVEISYSRSYMRLMDPADLPPRGYTEISLEILPSGLIVIPLTLKLQSGYLFDGRFIYDTGFGGILSINTPTMRKWELEKRIANKKKQYSSHYGVGGGAVQYLFKGESIIIGDYEIKMPLVDYSMNTDGISAMADYDGIAGNLLFEQFDHILDISKGKLYIKPGIRYGREFDELVSGFRCIDRRDIYNGFIVTSLYEGGPAEKSGIMLGDVITHIDGILIQQQTLKYFKATIEKPYIEYFLTIVRDDIVMNFRIRNGGYSLINQSLHDNHGIIRFR